MEPDPALAQLIMVRERAHGAFDRALVPVSKPLISIGELTVSTYRLGARDLGLLMVARPFPAASARKAPFRTSTN